MRLIAMIALALIIYESCHRKERVEKEENHIHIGEKHEIMENEKKRKIYYCPMHPQYTSDKPGSCPICGMNLVELKEEETTKRHKTYYCPMHPEYKSDKPGSCPICGMDLIELEEKKIQSAIHISPEKQQMIGVKFSEVRKIDLIKEIRTVAKFEYNEKNIFIYSLKFSGWIEKLYANFTGKYVRKDETLFEIYSPDVVSAQEEYLSVLRLAENKTGDFEEILQKAKRRLLWWSIPEDVVKEIEKTKEPKRAIPMKSPWSGFIIEKNIFEGKFVEAGENIFKIADISEIWAICDIYESDIQFIKIGTPVLITTSYSNKRFYGKVSFIYPSIDPQTRTVRIRVDISNKDFEVKAEMFGEAYIRVHLGQRLAIPESAVLDTGTKKIVFVDLGNGYIEPKEIETGERASGYIEVKNGLEELERVAESANFLINSESKLQEALKIFGPSKGTQHERMDIQR